MPAYELGREDERKVPYPRFMTPGSWALGIEYASCTGVCGRAAMAMTGTWEKERESGDVRVRDKNRDNRIVDQRDQIQAKNENSSKEKTAINPGKMAWTWLPGERGLVLVKVLVLHLDFTWSL